MEEFVQKCREQGIKITPQRTAIYQAVRGCPDHPTADDVLKKIRHEYPHISHDTVHRTLQTFVTMGLICLVEGYGSARRFDAFVGRHHHFWCRGCGTIFDIENRDYDSLTVPEAVARSFHVTDYKVVLEGLCENCVKSKNDNVLDVMQQSTRRNQDGGAGQDV